MKHTPIVQQIYAAFGRGDFAAILTHLSPAVDWEYGPGSTSVPWLQHRRGLEGAGEFFASLQQIEIHSFQPKEVLETGDVVVALIDIDLTVKASGQRFVEEDEVHIWRFGADGKVARFRHALDSHRHQLAVDAAQ